MRGHPSYATTIRKCKIKVWEKPFLLHSWRKSGGMKLRVEILKVESSYKLKKICSNLWFRQGKQGAQSDRCQDFLSLFRNETGKTRISEAVSTSRITHHENLWQVCTLLYHFWNFLWPSWILHRGLPNPHLCALWRRLSFIR